MKAGVPTLERRPDDDLGVCVSAFALSGGKKGAITGIAVAVGIAAFYIVVQRSFEAM